MNESHDVISVNIDSDVLNQFAQGIKNMDENL